MRFFLILFLFIANSVVAQYDSSLLDITFTERFNESSQQGISLKLTKKSNALPEPAHPLMIRIKRDDGAILLEKPIRIVWSFRNDDESFHLSYRQLATPLAKEQLWVEILMLRDEITLVQQEKITVTIPESYRVHTDAGKDIQYQYTFSQKNHQGLVKYTATPSKPLRGEWYLLLRAFNLKGEKIYQAYSPLKNNTLPIDFTKWVAPTGKNKVVLEHWADNGKAGITKLLKKDTITLEVPQIYQHTLDISYKRLEYGSWADDPYIMLYDQEKYRKQTPVRDNTCCLEEQLKWKTLHPEISCKLVIKDKDWVFDDPIETLFIDGTKNSDTLYTDRKENRTNYAYSKRLKSQLKYNYTKDTASITAEDYSYQQQVIQRDITPKFIKTIQTQPTTFQGARGWLVNIQIDAAYRLVVNDSTFTLWGLHGSDLPKSSLDLFDFSLPSSLTRRTGKLVDHLAHNYQFFIPQIETLGMKALYLRVAAPNDLVYAVLPIENLEYFPSEIILHQPVVSYERQGKQGGYYLKDFLTLPPFYLNTHFESDLKLSIALHTFTQNRLIQQYNLLSRAANLTLDDNGKMSLFIPARDLSSLRYTGSARAVLSVASNREGFMVKKDTNQIALTLAYKRKVQELICKLQGELPAGCTISLKTAGEISFNQPIKEQATKVEVILPDEYYEKDERILTVSQGSEVLFKVDLDSFSSKKRLKRKHPTYGLLKLFLKSRG